SWDDKITVLLGANLGLVVFIAAAIYFGRARPVLRDHELQLQSYVKPVILTCIICGIPAAWSLLATFGTSAGVIENTMIFDPETHIRINTTGNGYFVDMQLMLATLVGMFAYVMRFRWWSFLPLLVFILVKAGTGGRGPFIAAI